jgi:ribosomal 30S subunit maturation factor RimM
MQISDLIPIGKLGIPISQEDDFIIFRPRTKISLENLKDIFLVFPDHRVRYVTIDKVATTRKNRFRILETEVLEEMKNLKNVTVMLDQETWSRVNNEITGFLFNYKVEYKDKIIGKITTSFWNKEQLILVVKTNQHEFMVPKVPEFVSQIEEKQKLIVLKNIDELMQL